MRIESLPLVSYDPLDYPEYGYRKVDICIDADGEVGEGVWCLMKPLNLLRYDEGNSTSTSIAIICNRLGVYSGIVAFYGIQPGQIVPIQFNMEYRPTVPIEWIKKVLNLK